MATSTIQQYGRIVKKTLTGIKTSLMLPTLAYFSGCMREWRSVLCPSCGCKLLQFALRNFTLLILYFVKSLPTILLLNSVDDKLQQLLHVRADVAKPTDMLIACFQYHLYIFEGISSSHLKLNLSGAWKSFLYTYVTRPITIVNNIYFHFLHPCSWYDLKFFILR